MLYEQIFREIKSFVNFCKTSFYLYFYRNKDRESLPDIIEVKFSKLSNIHISRFDDLGYVLFYVQGTINSDEEPITDFKFTIRATQEEIESESTPHIEDLNIGDEKFTSSVLEDGISNEIEKSIDQLSYMFEEGVFEQVMIEVIRKLINSWTLPDDREELLGDKEEESEKEDPIKHPFWEAHKESIKKEYEPLKEKIDVILGKLKEHSIELPKDKRIPTYGSEFAIKLPKIDPSFPVGGDTVVCEKGDVVRLSPDGSAVVIDSKDKPIGTFLEPTPMSKEDYIEIEKIIK